MTATALTNARILTPDGIVSGCDLVMDSGRIRGLSEGAGADLPTIDLDGALLAPGFIDTQVNGGGGVLFNDDPCVATLATMARAHRRYGTTAMLPTLISDDLDKVARAIRAVDEAIACGVPGIAGIHLEGPFLAPARRGAHRADKLRRLEDADLSLLTSAQHGRTMVTLAPECATPEQIAHLAGAGVVVSLGHSNASFAQTSAALAAGATAFTHLFNAMSPLTVREPGMVGAALTSDRAIAGIIADGEHVHPGSLRVALRALGHQRLMLVTDAMSLADTSLANFTLQGRLIERQGNALRDAEGTLAGSALTMIEAVTGMMRLTDVSLGCAVAMATKVPARLLGLEAEIGAIMPGMRADLVAINDGLELVATWISGQTV